MTNHKLKKRSYDLTQLIPLLMRPPGGGISVVSTPQEEVLELQRSLYSLLSPQTFQLEKLTSFWRASWKGLGKARVVVLGVPSDMGAGIRKGAAYGPLGVRLALMASPLYLDWLRTGQVVDLGDLYVNPHFLHDEMLSSTQIEFSRSAMYPKTNAALRKKLAVSPLSQLKQILQVLVSEHPQLRLFMIGGDHSVAWPVTEVLASRWHRDLGIVQPDAHTDLLASRLGVKYCFGSWSYHANTLLGRQGKLVQVGIRQSARPKEFWEKKYQVRQFWASEITSERELQVIEEIIAHLKKVGVQRLYFSNDIDGTDSEEAKATGTPAPAGLTSQFILKLIEKLSANFEVVAADIVEVAPDLAPTVADRTRTCSIAAQYAMASIQGML